jgi:hypothetical protein
MEGNEATDETPVAVCEDLPSESSSGHTSTLAVVRPGTGDVRTSGSDSDTPLSEYPRKRFRSSSPNSPKSTEAGIFALGPDGVDKWQTERLASGPTDGDNSCRRPMHPANQLEGTSSSDVDGIARSSFSVELRETCDATPHLANRSSYPDKVKANPGATEISHNALCTLIRAMLKLESALDSVNVASSENVVVDAFQGRFFAVEQSSPKRNIWTLRMEQIQYAKERELKHALIRSLSSDFALDEPQVHAKQFARSGSVNILDCIQDGGAKSCIDDLTEFATNDPAAKYVLRDFMKWMLQVCQSTYVEEFSNCPVLSEAQSETRSRKILIAIQRTADVDKSLESTAAALAAVLTQNAESGEHSRSETQISRIPRSCSSPASSGKIPDVPEQPQKNSLVETDDPAVDRARTEHEINGEKRAADARINGGRGKIFADALDASDPCRREAGKPLPPAIESRGGVTPEEIPRLKVGASCDAEQVLCIRQIPEQAVLPTSAAEESSFRPATTSAGVEGRKVRRLERNLGHESEDPAVDAITTYGEIPKKRYRAGGYVESGPISVYRESGRSQVARPLSSRHVTFPRVGIVDPCRSCMPHACEIVRIAPRAEVAHLFSDPQDLLDLDGASEGFRREVEENIRASTVRTVLLLHAAVRVRIEEAIAERDGKRWEEPTSLVVPEPPTP